MALVSILKKYRLEPSDETPSHPLKVYNKGISIAVRQVAKRLTICFSIKDFVNLKAHFSFYIYASHCYGRKNLFADLKKTVWSWNSAGCKELMIFMTVWIYGRWTQLAFFVSMTHCKANLYTKCLICLLQNDATDSIVPVRWSSTVW